jgi:hypothetical protein
MGFRAAEVAETNLRAAVQHMTQWLKPEQRAKAERVLREIVEDCGPVVESYPVWHPLVDTGKHTRDRFTDVRPSWENGWSEGIDHAVLMRSGFITSPYRCSADVVAAAEALTNAAKGEMYFTAEVLPKGALYNDAATPVVVRMEMGLESDGTIERWRATRGVLEWASTRARHAQAYATQCAEPWENLTGMLLGYPNGKRSSLVINEATGNAMRKMVMAINQSGALDGRRA